MRAKFIYLALNYLIQFLDIVLNLIFIQRLPTAVLGDIAIAKIWLQVFDYTHLGTRFSLDRYLPMTRNDNYRKAFLYIALLTCLFGSLFVISVYFLFYESNRIVLSFCLVGLSLSFFNIIKAYFRAVEDISKVNYLMFFVYALPILLSVLASFYSFSLFLWVYSSSYVFVFVFVFSYILLKKGKLSLNRKKFISIKRKVFYASKPLFFNSIVVYLSFIVDRLYVDWSLGREELGRYSVLMFVFAFLYMVPSILAELIFPKIVYRVVKYKQIFFLKETIVMVSLTLAAVIVANLGVFFLIPNYTKYGELSNLMHITTLGVIPYAFIAIFYHVLNALDKRYIIFNINLVYLILYSFLLFVASSFNSLGAFVFTKVFSVIFLFLLYVVYLISQNKTKAEQNA